MAYLMRVMRQLSTESIGNVSEDLVSSPMSFIRTFNKDETDEADVGYVLLFSQTELITSKGFPCESYYVLTEDGYILNILRIPHGRNNSDAQSASRPVVVLQHGLLGSCTNFLTNPVNESLAYLLADAGADVWLGNSRGNIYSTNHTHLSPSTREFWNFSWDEMATFDLPATINFVRDKSGADKVYYVGHSQGTTIAFSRLSEDQELASHIKHFIALAPVARVGYAPTPLRKLAPYADQIKVPQD
ncbi:gastric triacylglycerol lipase [Aplysia californica]|uniref:Gastric triacylglycerol lipase n=1 Tax=Aplysia californica TaxID=6500 RepID=A0ABM1VVD1_APLCA|nr:gastric triacylglycerol lipase [Aplysia californica]